MFIHFRMQSVQNLGLALITMLAGLIVDLKGYLVLEMFYMVWLCGKFREYCTSQPETVYWRYNTVKLTCTHINNAN